MYSGVTFAVRYLSNSPYGRHERAFYCRLAHWSRAALARYVAATPGLPSISASTIGRWLAAEQIRPWRYHSWQHIQDPEADLSRARPVLQLYEQATVLLEQGIWVVCADEKTSIQAREAEQAPRPAIPKHPVYQSPRYIRRGALQLMAALSVADGLVYGQCHEIDANYTLLASALRKRGSER